jgi:hypothetical protein
MEYESQSTSALRYYIARAAQLPAFSPIARRLRSRFSSEKFVTFPLGQLGRFGNQLFQIAATIGIARRNGCSFVFPAWPYSRHFEFPVPQIRFVRQFQRRHSHTFGYEDIAIDRPTELWGYYQSPRYFDNCEDEVRHYFTPHHVLSKLLDLGYADLIAGKTCSVHVRRTDYVGDSFWPDLSATDYYERAMAQFDADTTFVIFSDDLEWCKQRFRGRSMFFVEALSEVEDLFLMARCKGHIIANSTFSWWGAWLDPNKDKKVVAPARWIGGAFTDNSKPYRYNPAAGGFRGHFDTSDLVPPEWIRI